MKERILEAVIIIALVYLLAGCGTIDGVGKLAQGIGQDLSDGARGYQQYAYEHKDD